MGMSIRIEGSTVTTPDTLSRKVVLRTSRETLLLVAGACGLTFAIAYAVHSRPLQTIAAPQPTEQQAWAGQLADIGTSTPAKRVTEPLTSASLTVPKSQLALPAAAKVSVVKPRSCENGSSCAPKATAASLASTRPAAAGTAILPPNRKIEETGVMARLNPLNHVPDVVRKPFVVAGEAVSGWLKRF